ncbi:thiamine pyrophosphate-requiring protein [Ensifer sp. 4252]|uniref:thiamine pyrophosphate-requiring protein n=1 Tax=Ensifer sp. 4252 TaxID=3373915 RepID=UPI003D262994
MKFTGSDLVAKVLQNEGVENIIGFPHSELFDSCAALGIRPVIARTERVAVNMAEGFSRMTGGQSTGVVTAQYGPGVETAFGAVAQAYGDNAPILVLPTAYPRGAEVTAPNFQASRNFRHITKWAESAAKVEQLPQLMQYVFSRLRNGGPGPVMLELPTDLLAEEFKGEFNYVSPRRSAPVPDANELAELANALVRAKSPVIYAGQGVLYSRAWDELKALAELVGAPVLTTVNGKSAFPENHPLALGTGGKSRPATVDEFLKRADLVVAVGTSLVRSAYVTAIPAGKTIAHITVNEADIAKDYPVSLGVIGDAKAVLTELRRAVSQHPSLAERPNVDDVARGVASVRRDFMAKWMPLLTSNETPITPYRIIWDLMKVVDRTKTVVTHDAGQPRDQITPFYEAIVPHGYMGWGRTTQLGSGLGLMLGAKLARPDWLAVNIMGEAAFGMIGMDVETAVRAGLPILTIVLRNEIMGGYGGYMPTATQRYGANKLSGEYTKVAEGLGAYSEHVAKPEDLVPAMQRCIRSISEGRTAVLEVRTREEPRLAGITAP